MGIAILLYVAGFYLCYMKLSKDDSEFQEHLASLLVACLWPLFVTLDAGKDLWGLVKGVCK